MKNKYYNYFTAVIIISNIISYSFFLQKDLEKFKLFEKYFLKFYILEILGKFVISKIKYEENSFFSSGWNIIDLFVTITTLFNLYIFSNSIFFFSPFRLFRLLKVIQINDLQTIVFEVFSFSKHIIDAFFIFTVFTVFYRLKFLKKNNKIISILFLFKKINFK